MMRYSIEPRKRKYGFSSFARNLSKKYGKQLLLKGQNFKCNTLFYHEKRDFQEFVSNHLSDLDLKIS